MSANDNWQQQAWQPPVSSGNAPSAQPPAVGAPQAYYQYASAGPVYSEEPKKKGKGWIVALVAIILIFLLLVIGMVTCSSMVGGSLNGLGSASAGSSYTDIGYMTDDTIAIIGIDGTIQYDGSTNSPEGLKEKLDQAEENQHVKAVVLRVNSGGGVATAGEEMARYVRDFSKPVVVSSASINASAAYEISSQADYIYTAKTTAIGSIGTILSITDLSGLYEKLGIKMEDITSSENKNAGSGNRPLTDEEREYYQEMVDAINETFIQTVAEGRGMDTEEVRALATGLTFTGMGAVENGLADEIGTLEDACDKAAELSGISSYDTVTLSSSYDLSMLELLDLLGYSASDSQELLARLEGMENNGAFTN